MPVPLPGPARDYLNIKLIKLIPLSSVLPPVSHGLGRRLPDLDEACGVSLGRGGCSAKHQLAGVL